MFHSLLRVGISLLPRTPEQLFLNFSDLKKKKKSLGQKRFLAFLNQISGPLPWKIECGVEPERLFSITVLANSISEG